MTATDTGALRELADELAASPPVSGVTNTHVSVPVSLGAGIVVAMRLAADELDAARNQLIYAEAALAGETAQREHYSAYGITHNGMLLYCSSGMRDAYSELRVELDAARARIAELDKDAGRLRKALSWAAQKIEELQRTDQHNPYTARELYPELFAAIDAAMAQDGVA